MNIFLLFCHVFKRLFSHFLYFMGKIKKSSLKIFLKKWKENDVVLQSSQTENCNCFCFLLSVCYLVAVKIYNFWTNRENNWIFSFWPRNTVSRRNWRAFYSISSWWMQNGKSSSRPEGDTGFHFNCIIFRKLKIYMIHSHLILGIDKWRANIIMLDGANTESYNTKKQSILFLVERKIKLSQYPNKIPRIYIWI